MASMLPCVRPHPPVDRWSDEPLPLGPGEKNDPPSTKRPSPGEGGSHRLVRFLIPVSIGVAATLAWQSYGNVAKEMIAHSAPVLGWLAPQPAPLTQAAADQVTPAEPAMPSSDVQHLRAALLELAAVRQSVDQLAAQHHQLAGDVATMQAAQQDILRKVAAPAPLAPRQAGPARNAMQN